MLLKKNSPFYKKHLVINKNPDVNYYYIDTHLLLLGMLSILRDSNVTVISVDLETNSLDTSIAEINSIVLSNNGIDGYLIDLNDEITIDILLKELYFLEDASIIKVFHNYKYDLSILERLGFKVNNIQCTMLNEWILNGCRTKYYSLKDLSQKYFNLTPIKLAPLLKEYGEYKNIPFNIRLVYTIHDAIYTYKLYIKQESELLYLNEILVLYNTNQLNSVYDYSMKTRDNLNKK